MFKITAEEKKMIEERRQINAESKIRIYYVSEGKKELVKEWPSGLGMTEFSNVLKKLSKEKPMPKGATLKIETK